MILNSVLWALNFFFFLANQQPNLKTYLPKSQNIIFQGFLDLAQINKKITKKKISSDLALVFDWRLAINFRPSLCVRTFLLAV